MAGLRMLGICAGVQSPDLGFDERYNRRQAWQAVHLRGWSKRPMGFEPGFLSDSPHGPPG